MLARTHFFITLLIALIFFPFSLLFLLISIIATLLPDIDSRFSKLGKYKIFRPLNFFTKHKGMIHSFSFLSILGILFFIFLKEYMIPFILGYSIHLVLDSLTLTGIAPFYPFKWRIKGRLKTGGVVETILFIISLIGVLFLLFTKFFNIF